MLRRKLFLLACATGALAATAAPALATRYVALGDSYSSGTGTRTYYDSSCQRSVYAYPDLVHNKIKSLSPTAKVIVLGYPHLFMGEDCNAGTFFSPAEETRLNQTADMLRDALQSAGTRAGANFIFKDAIPPFIGHAICDSVE